MSKRAYALEALTLFAMLILLHPDVRQFFLKTQLTWLYLIAQSFCLTFTLVPIVRRIAPMLGAIDTPGGRKQHDHPTPLMGGAAIFLGYALVMILGRDILHFSYELKGVAIGGTDLSDRSTG
jgi:UDP-N-acetylmuramyl pentapeptide phosphotransferase/UDP-N-acetylglucosamine-1-phosphate transferase